jgi:hypothetical protein
MGGTLSKVAIDTNAEGVCSVAFGNTLMPSQRMMEAGIGTKDGMVACIHAEKVKRLAGMVIGLVSGSYIIAKQKTSVFRSTRAKTHAHKAEHVLLYTVDDLS